MFSFSYLSHLVCYYIVGLYIEGTFFLFIAEATELEDVVLLALPLDLPLDVLNFFSLAF
jgi:hypothetical protein